MVDVQLEALGVETRRHIYEMLLQRPRSVGELANDLPVSRPAVSQHLKILVDAGLARSSVSGTRHIYSADPTGLTELRAWTDRMWSSVIDHFATFTTGKEQAMLAEEVKVEPIVKTRSLALSPDQAFALFTEKIAEWWPLSTHSVAEADAVSVRIEARVGGKIVETSTSGEEFEWGTITSWEKGRRLEFTWHPGRSDDEQTYVEVRFREIADGSELMLIHSGWEVRGESAAAARSGYDTGWDLVLGEYQNAVEPA